jgi:hypothetical protein
LGGVTTIADGCATFAFGGSAAATDVIERTTKRTTAVLRMPFS